MKHLFLIAIFSALNAEEAPLSLATGPTDDLSTDRGWVSSSSEPQTEEEPEIVDSRTPEILAASLRTASAAEQIKRQPPGLYFSSRQQALRVDNAGNQRRFVGTEKLRPFKGDFILEFEVTTVLAGRSPANFGVSDTPNKLEDAANALYIEYRAFDARSPYLRLMVKTPQKLQELGRIESIGRLNDKLIRISRTGNKIVLETQQDYVPEGRLEADASGETLSWIGSAYRDEVPTMKGERTILNIDNIRGLDPEQPAPPLNRLAHQLPERALKWPPSVKVNGIDVTSPAYARSSGLAVPLKIIKADLSSAAWQETSVVPGNVAVDPQTHRLCFSKGNGVITKLGAIEILRGKPEHLVIRDGIGYMAHGDGSPDSHLVILDLKAETPRVISSIGLQWWPKHLDVQGGIAFIPNGVHLQLVDVSNPASPRIISTFKDNLGLGKGEATVVAVNGRNAYLAAAKLGLLVIDVAEPKEPRLLGSVRMPLFGPTDILVRENLVWLTSSDGITLFDVTNPQRPLRMETGKVTAASDAREGLGLGLGLDLETKPKKAAKAVDLKALEMARYPLGLALTDEYLFVVDKKKGLLVFDNANPLQPESLGEYVPSAGRTVRGIEVHATSITVTEQTAFLTVNYGTVPQIDPDTGETIQRDAGGGLHILSVADPLQPLLMGRFRLPETPIEFVKVQTMGTKAMVLDARYGVWSVECEDELAPRLLGGVPTQGEIRDMVIEHGRAYLASAQGQGILVVDVADPASPKLIGQYHTGFDTPSLAVSEGVVYTGSPEWMLPHGLHVLNLREPSSPQFVRSLQAKAAPQWSTISELLFSSGGEVYNLQDPFFPEPFGQLPSGAVLREDGLFYIARPNALKGLLILDPRHKENPVRSQLNLSLDSAGRGDIEKRGNMLFMAAGSYGVAIADVGDTNAPRLVKMLKSNIGSAVDVAIHQSAIIVNDIYAGLKIYDAADPARPRLRTYIPYEKWTTGYSISVTGNLLYHARLNGLDIYKLPNPSQAPSGNVTLE
ncbi:MAG: hypothetical protein O2857_17915 [Planctomycetota bacterium]|nr:hypothetical protein [Planctomycetota bacterium]